MRNTHVPAPVRPVSSRKRLLEGAAQIEAITGAGAWSRTFGGDSAVWSPGLYALLGLPHTVKPSYRTLHAHIYPADRGSWNAEFATSVAERHSFEMTHRILTASGSQRTVLSRVSTVFDDDRPLYAVGTMVDITNQQRVRRKLDDATAQLMAVWEHVQEGFVLVDAQRTIIDCNPFAERLLGRARSALVGHDVAMLHPEGHRSRIALRFDQAIATPLRDMEATITRPDGTSIDVEISSSGAFHFGDRALSLTAFRDISGRKRAERAAARTAGNAARIARASLAIIRARDRNELLRAVCAEIVGDSIVLATVTEPHDDPEQPCRQIASAGRANGYVQTIELRWSESSPLGRGPFGLSVRTGRASRGSVRDPAFAPWRRSADRYGIATSLALPVIEDGRVTAVYSLYSNDADFFDDAEIALFESLAGDIGLGLRAFDAHDEAVQSAYRERERATELTAALEGALSAISTTLEKRDPYTAGHMRRVAELARLIAGDIGLDADRARGLFLAALVHDIGKIGIPAEILTKPAKLNDVEYAFVKQHAQFGADIVKNIPFHWPIAEIVLQHHEYLDGSGYPRGLRADDILFESRILTVADIVESMTSVRPYHVAAGTVAALAEIRRLAGTRLDPIAVDACIRIVEAGALERPEFATSPDARSNVID